MGGRYDNHNGDRGLLLNLLGARYPPPGGYYQGGYAQPGAYPPPGGYLPPGGYPQAGYPSYGGYPSQAGNYPPAYPTSSAPYHSGPAYGAHNVSHGYGTHGYGGYGHHQGKIKHGKFKHGGKHGGYGKWK